MRKNTLIIVSCILLLASCSQNETPLEEPYNSVFAGNPYKVPLGKALLNAEILLSEIDGASTRSQRSVESVSYVENAVKTRSGNELPDTLLYIVNYADNGGFAVLSADARTRPIYAISGEGHLEMSDTVTNKGLALFFQGAEADYADAIIVAGDSVVAGGDDYPVISKHSRGISPLLSKSQRTWSQGNPFNEFCFTTSGEQSVVGCVALAVGLVMSYYSFPNDYAGYSFNWSDMNSNHESKALHMFLKLLGNPENLNNNYGIDQTTAESYTVSGTFENMGYNNPGSFLNFSSDKILSDLNNSPILVLGRAKGGGHAWVIDGYLQYEDYNTQVSFETGVVYEDPMFHCVWGWGGSNNGYFFLTDGSIDSRNPTESDNDETDLTTSSVYGSLIYLSKFSPKYK